MASNTAEYGPEDIAKKLFAPMMLIGKTKLTFHSELADRIKQTMETSNRDAELIVEFLQANNYLWHFDVENSTEKSAYILTEKGKELLRRYL